MEKTEYLSNLFKSTKEIDYRRFPCYKLDLVVSEDEAWRRLGENNVLIPYYIARNSIFYSDSRLADFDFLKMIVKGKSRKVTISNENSMGSRIIGGILYRAMRNYLVGLGFQNVGGIAANSIYIENNEMYIKEITGHEGEGSYTVFRGFGPKIYAGAIMGEVYFFIETRSKFRITVPHEKWSKWIGWPVATSRKKELFRGSATLKKVDKNKNIAIVTQGENKFNVPLDSVYIPASPAVLRKRNLYEDLLEFAQFRCERDVVESSFDFLSIVFKKIIRKNSIMLGLDEEKKIKLEFRNVNFINGA